LTKGNDWLIVVNISNRADFHQGENRDKICTPLGNLFWYKLICSYFREVLTQTFVQDNLLSYCTKKTTGGIPPMAEGRIKWYSEKKGYGFIESEKHGEVFFHKTGIEDPGFFGLKQSDLVSFEIKETSRGKQAVKVRPI
jgi:CspA family cold shock protein